MSQMSQQEIQEKVAHLDEMGGRLYYKARTFSLVTFSLPLLLFALAVLCFPVVAIIYGIVSGSSEAVVAGFVQIVFMALFWLGFKYCQ